MLFLQSAQVSKSCFSKLSGIWKSLEVQGNPELLQQIMQGSWLLFISIRSAKLNKTNSLSDCMYLLVGVVSFVLERLPSYLSATKDLVNIASNSLIFTDPERNFWTERVLEFAREYLIPLGVQIKDDRFKGFFSRKHVKNNLNVVSKFYETCLDIECFDERELAFNMNDSLRFGSGFSAPKKNISGKILRYEVEHSDFNDVANTSVVPTTPMTMSMEMLKWITELVQEKYDLKELIQEDSELAENALEYQDIIDKLVVSHGQKVQSIYYFLNYQDNFIEAKIWVLYDSLYRKLTKEKSNELNFKYDEQDFLLCLFVFCVETVFYQKNVTFISFAEVLNTYSCSGFVFFRFIPAFSNISKIPAHYKLHLGQIEMKILMHIGWKENSSIHLLIQEYINNSNAEPQENNFNRYKGIFPEDYEIFFDRMITEAGVRIDTLCKSLKIEKTIKEKIWSTVKYILSEKTEIIFGRHISVIILCSIFAVSKLINPIKFASLADEYRRIYEEEEGIFSSLKLRNGKNVEIIDFYNTEFIQIAKEFLENRIGPIKPRVAALNPSNSLAQQIIHASPQKKSPFTTPRTKFLLASPNTQTNTIGKLKVLSFDSNEPPKLPRLVERMLQQNNEGMIPMPVIKKNPE
ncbi:hypothetical protein SteCoe_13153 [Stentor coeruleus]|uniref:Retinoblastoma-associated protein A-box domain-containing protein n=1 Tax=Stentor coeruleus TaxID=5963 RepID=A0A1R2C993_9CILI|nr:hypothetical protein SteCoe_13153 [Stentor coeruleus]